jgi:RNA polymerase sigma factor (sigma-70 family)
MMKKYTDPEIIDGIANDKSKVLMFVYREYFPFIENFVYKHGGTSDQAQDLFQDGMIVIFKKIKAGNLKLFCKFSTYLYAVCKRIWIQERRKNAHRMNKMTEEGIAAEPTVTYGEETIDEAKLLFDKHLNQLSPDCQKILRLHFNDCTVEEIRNAMNYNTAHHAVDRKYRCKKSLIDRIINDPSFRKFLK